MKVRDLLKKGKPIELMSPNGYISLSAEKVNEILEKGECKIFSHPFAPEAKIPVEQEEVLNYELIHGGYDKNLDAFVYLVDYSDGNNKEEEGGCYDCPWGNGEGGCTIPGHCV